jgi:hypothetical protein
MQIRVGRTMANKKINSAKKKNKKTQYRFGRGLSWCLYRPGTSLVYVCTLTLVFGIGLAGM